MTSGSIDLEALRARLAELDEQRQLAEAVEPYYIRHVLLGALDTVPACEYLHALADFARTFNWNAALASLGERRGTTDETKEDLSRAGEPVSHATVPATAGSNEHELKCWPEFFEAVASGRKRFEIRHDDRAFKVGDGLLLNEYAIGKGYTGRSLRFTISYMTDWQQRDDYVVLGLESGRTDQPEVTSWSEALRDAENQLAEAKKKVRNLTAAVRVCRERNEAGEPWPCETAEGK